MTFRLLTDFNDVRDGAVAGLQKYVEGSRPLRRGDRVLLHDDGEHEAWATVIDVAGGLVKAQVDWRT